MKSYRLIVAVSCLACLSSTMAAEKEIPGWGTAVDVDGDCIFLVVDGKLRITAPGPVHGFSIELERMNAPRVMREVSGDFLAELTVTGEFAPGEKTLKERTPFNGAGIVLMQDEKNYVLLRRAALERNGEYRHYSSFIVRENAQATRYIPADNPNVENMKPTQLRLERRGDTIYGSVRQGTGLWQHMIPKDLALEKDLNIGIIAVNASSQQFTAEFSELKLTSKSE